MLDEILNVFPGLFTHREDSNFYKLLKVIVRELQAKEQLIEFMGEVRGFESAIGSTLDELGADFGLYRGMSKDDVFRTRIKAHAISNRSSGSINQLIDIAATSLRCKPNEINLVELGGVNESGNIIGEPMAIRFDGLPLSLIKRDEDLRQLMEVLEANVPAGIRLDSIAFQDEVSGDIYLATAISHGESYELAAIDESDSGAANGLGTDYELPENNIE
ncbi:hypothetical protein EQG49_12875 [Periweissella cryptocerci]|uniref:DUF2612 domain-containing protein n=1 Tax=Periweissella cryptocerci TaxID=2506420 RepID=A0A4P6YWR5_9LACO|nr:hypothetical protein [Periweissella cryptocerci]QBO37290.1 hypothetical protein EQG49_12875 [Periweissella cryptocerci]